MNKTLFFIRGLCTFLVYWSAWSSHMGSIWYVDARTCDDTLWLVLQHCRCVYTIYVYMCMHISS
jgi:hypothetical protein